MKFEIFDKLHKKVCEIKSPKEFVIDMDGNVMQWDDYEKTYIYPNALWERYVILSGAVSYAA